MGDWGGEIGPDDGDVVFRTPQQEILRLRKDGSFIIAGAEANDSQVADGLRRWVLACRERQDQPDEQTRHEPTDIVLTVNPSSAVVATETPLPTRTRSALDALRASLKERAETRTRTITSLAEMLATFQRVMRPLVIELGATAKTIAKERLTALFDTGDTLCIGVFGLEWTGAQYVLYHTGRRTITQPVELATYLVDNHAGLDIEEAMNKIASGIEVATEKVVKALGSLDRIRTVSVDLRKKLEEGEPKALSG